MSEIYNELKKYASAKRKKSNEWFFKTGVGQYGEGDKFMGVSNPDARKVVGKFAHLGFADIKSAMDSEIHEVRLAGILILVKQYEWAIDDKAKQKILNFYLKNLKRVNNWDLVDLSASRILGMAMCRELASKSVLDELVVSKNMWYRRVAIISTMASIKYGVYGPTLHIAKKLLADKEDLMHKAVGWALREVWKRDAKTCEDFLIKNYKNLPRTTLRYAIERMEEAKRKGFLKYKK